MNERRKLRLNRTTLRLLTDAQTQMIMGGRPPNQTGNCTLFNSCAATQCPGPGCNDPTVAAGCIA
jgi:hypothetical protein